MAGWTGQDQEGTPPPCLDSRATVRSSSVPAARAGSIEVEAIEVPAVRIPATVAEAGCVVRHDAPAGCLAKIEFSPAWIPAVRVPGFRVVQPNGTVKEVPGREVEARVVEAGRWNRSARSCARPRPAGSSAAV